MAGVYGEINSRADYHRLLRQATHFAVSQSPSDTTMQQIRKQLDAMRLCTDNDREPSEKERRSLNVGLIAARELDIATGKAKDLANKLHALHNYFEDWPTDEQAASANDDFFETTNH
jgi:hypothetical protein